MKQWKVFGRRVSCAEKCFNTWAAVPKVDGKGRVQDLNGAKFSMAKIIHEALGAGNT